jgi:hypothetical protein
MIINTFDKSQLEKKLTYFGDDNEAHLMIRSVKGNVRAYIRQRDAWMFDEPDKERGELADLEQWYDNLRDLHNVSAQAIFNGELIYVSDDIAYLVALSSFRRAVVLGVDPSTHNLHKLREYICDGPNGIDDLLDMKPYTKPVGKVVAEAEVEIDGQKFTSELTE